MTNVLPDFALPVIATSSRRGKHGLSYSWNRNSIFGNSFSGVILNCSSNSICGLRAVSSPACSSSASNWLITFSSITSFCLLNFYATKLYKTKDSDKNRRSLRSVIRTFRMFFRAFRSQFRRSMSRWASRCICSVAPSSFHLSMLPDNFPLTMGFWMLS